MRDRLKRVWRITRVLVLSLGVLAAGGSATWMAGTSAAPTGSSTSTAAMVESGERILRPTKDQVTVPQAVAEKIKLCTSVVSRPKASIPLPPFHGALALDNSALARVHARFPGEVVALGTNSSQPASVGKSQDLQSRERALRPGDRVKKGQVLAVVWSRDLGMMKSQLVDAVTNLRTDEENLKRLEELYQQGGSERSVRDARQKVQGDKNAVATAERALKTARLTNDEIAAVRAEASRLLDVKADSSDLGDWARVELRSPQDGEILEMNVSEGLIVDTTTDLFRIGDLSHLVVWAHVYEDDLQALALLPRPIPWTVSLPSRSGNTYAGSLEQIGSVIDTNQHTALVTGRVNNPTGDLKIGQFATVTVSIPASAEELIVPAEAVVEDGKESVVFVQSAENATTFNRTTIHVVRRTQDAIYFRAEQSAIQPGERVVTQGSLMLNDVMDSLPFSATR